MLLIHGAAFPQRWSASLSCWTSSGVNAWQRPTRRNIFLPSISPFPSPVDSVLTRSQSAWVSKSLVKTSRLGSVVAGSPARTAAMIRRYFKGLLRPFLRHLHAPDPRYGAPAPRLTAEPALDGAKRAPQACSSGANKAQRGGRHRALYQLTMFIVCSEAYIHLNVWKRMEWSTL